MQQKKQIKSVVKASNPILVKDEPMITLSSQMGRKFYDDFMKAFILDGFEPNIVKRSEFSFGVFYIYKTG